MVCVLSVQVWSLPTQRFLFTLTGHLNWVRSCQISPDGRVAVTGSDDRSIKLWDLRTHKVIRSYGDLGPSPTMVSCVKFHPDGTCVASAGNDSAIRLWDLRSDALVQQYQAHGGAVTDMAWHPSGNFLLSSSLDSTLKVWDVREGQLFYTLHGHEGATLAVNFSPAGEYFASAGADEQVLVWKTNFDRQLEGYALGSAVPARAAATAAAPAGSQAAAAASSASSAAPGALPPRGGGAAAAGRLAPSSSSSRPASGKVSQGKSHSSRQGVDQLTSAPAAAAAAEVADANRDAGIAGASRVTAAPWVEREEQRPQQQQQQPLAPAAEQDVYIEAAAPMNLEGVPAAIAATLQHLSMQMDYVTQTLVSMQTRLAMNEDRMQLLESKLVTLALQQPQTQGQGSAGRQHGSPSQH